MNPLLISEANPATLTPGPAESAGPHGSFFPATLIFTIVTIGSVIPELPDVNRIFLTALFPPGRAIPGNAA